MKINPICRSDQTLSRYTPWYTLRSSVFFLSTSGFSDYSVFFVNIQRIPKHDFPRALFCRAALLKHVLVATAVFTTRRALSPCDVEGSLDKPVNFDHIGRPFDGTIRRACLEYVLVPTAVSTTRRALSLPATSKALLTSLLISPIAAT